MNRRYHPNPRMDIPISLEVWHQLLGASTNTKFEKEDWEIAAEAIEEWMRRHAPDSLATPVAAGYQWKRLFLPTGTLLRTVFNAKNHHCMVEGDQILYQGEAVSPSGFVNAVGGIRRNAWRCTWIRFPDSKEWQLADTLRTRESPRRTRKPVAPSRQAAARQPVVSYDGGRVAAGVPAYAPDRAPDRAAASGLPVPARVEAIEAHGTNASALPSSQQAIDSRAQQARSGSAQEDTPEPQPPSAPMPQASVQAAHHPRGAERRAGTDSRMAALLQQELLPLLYRLCSLDAFPVAARIQPGSEGAMRA